MKIIIDIPDHRWELFKALQCGTAQSCCNGNFEDLVSRIMQNHFDNYIEALDQLKKGLEDYGKQEGQ